MCLARHPCAAGPAKFARKICLEFCFNLLDWAKLPGDVDESMLRDAGYEARCQDYNTALRCGTLAVKSRWRRSHG